MDQDRRGFIRSIINITSFRTRGHIRYVIGKAQGKVEKGKKKMIGKLIMNIGVTLHNKTFIIHGIRVDILGRCMGWLSWRPGSSKKDVILVAVNNYEEIGHSLRFKNYV